MLSLGTMYDIDPWYLMTACLCVHYKKTVNKLAGKIQYDCVFIHCQLWFVLMRDNYVGNVIEMNERAALEE